MSNDWYKLCIKHDSSIIDCISLIDKTADRMALIVDNNNHLVGIVTDGDIRRALLKNLSIVHGKVDAIMNENPVVFRTGADYGEMLQQMYAMKVFKLPKINKKGQLIGFVSLDDLRKERKLENRVVLMAGGLGMRLRPLTKNTPKPMLKVGGRPILDTIISQFKKEGFYKFYLAVNYQADKVKNYFKDGKKYGVEIKYLHEQKPLGTAGALSLLEEKLEEPFFVMNGDIISSMCFVDLLCEHVATNSIATMCVREHETKIPFGVVETSDGEISSIVEKPVQQHFINAGIYMLNPEALSYLEHNKPVDMTDLFDNLRKNKEKTTAKELKDYWLDVGRFSDFNQAQEEFFEVMQHVSG